MGIILIIDDDSAIRDSLEMILQYENYPILKASDGREALGILEKQHDSIDLALLDIKMPGMDGLEVLEIVRKLYPDIAVIMISGNAEIGHAVQATRKGAFDFLEKPLDENRILVTIQNALKDKKLRQQNSVLYEQNSVLKQIAFSSQDRQILGQSQQMLGIFNTIKLVAMTEARVLITGENGTGKELVARSIHQNSTRIKAPFVDVNCAAMPDHLIESELFGHEKGSFTHAFERHIGKFELANQGTIFLDEIGDMSLSAQAKVLRVLEEGKLERVGGNQSIKINVRVIAATNKDLQQLCRSGEFREDLYYRLNVVPIHLPPLRERQEDIPVLVQHFLVTLAKKYNCPIKKITPDAMELLQSYQWPGNVRELRNMIERLVILSDKDVIGIHQVKNYLPSPTTHASEVVQGTHTFEDFKRESEKVFILNQLIANNWNIKKTADVLQMQRSNLYKKMEKYGLVKPNI